MNYKYILLGVLMIIYLGGISQNSRKAEQMQKRYEKKQEEQKREAEKKYRAALKEHYKMQSPSTRRSMKKNFRSSMRDSENKQEFFIKRWYHNLFNKRKMKENRQYKDRNPHHKV